MIQVHQIRVKHHPLGVLERKNVKIDFSNDVSMKVFRSHLDEYWHAKLEVIENPEGYFDILSVEMDYTVKK